jgi:undecaprenyl-diphosphatase
MLAVLPGISRSGATIATGLYLGNKKEYVAKFSFLMVLIPIIGANVKDLMDSKIAFASSVQTTPLIVGFLAAFVSGLLACKWMLKIVQQGKLIYFAIYCFIIGSIAIIFSF